MSTDGPIPILPAEISGRFWRAGFALLVLIAVIGFWSSKAELATTIRVPGILGSASLSYDVQLPVRGRLTSVDVVLFDTVTLGDPMFRLDRREETSLRAALLVQQNYLLAENREIQAALFPQIPPMQTVFASDIDSKIADEYQLRQQALKIRLATLTEQARLQMLDVDSIRQEIATALQVQALLSQQLNSIVSLVEKGAAPRQQVFALQERLLNLAAVIAKKNAAVVTGAGSVQQALQEIEGITAAERFDLAAKLRANTQALLDINGQIERLTIKIDAGLISAPISGLVTQLAFDTPHSVAGAGETLAVISQPLRVPMIELRIPPKNVDQLTVGQTGQVVLTSLPQRQMPVLNMTVTALSAQAVLDQDGTPLHYLATASFDVKSLEIARQSLGDRFNLVRDMPVAVTLNGPTTTLVSFLMKPILSMRGAAFEE